MSLRPYRKGIPVERIRVTGGLTVTRDGIGPEVTLDGAGAGGMKTHGNEYHSPEFADTYHRHTGSDGTSQVSHDDLIDVSEWDHFTHTLTPEVTTWNGSASTITLTNASVALCFVTLDGRILTPNVDYTHAIGSTTIQMKDGAGGNWAPPSGSVSLVSYIYAAS